MMKRPKLFPLLILLSVTGCFSVPVTGSSNPATQIPVVQYTETFAPPPPNSLPTFTPAPVTTVELRRGVNLSNALEAPREGDWGLIIEEEYFDRIKEAGFDFVRLPVTWNGHAEVSAPYTIDPLYFLRVDEVVGWAIERELKIIIELHSYSDLMIDPRGQHDRFLAIWKQVAEHYTDYPSSLLFELLNEPSQQLSASLWNDYIIETLAVIRQTNPTRAVVLGSTHWSMFEWVTTLDLPEDPYILVTFHYYSPADFTTQGAEWVENSNEWLGTTWEGTVQQKTTIVRDFDYVAAWATRHNVQILLGEFGAYSKAPMDSRAHWTAFIREQAEARGFAWAYWEFGAGFGVYDPQTDQWREPLLQALFP